MILPHDGDKGSIPNDAKAFGVFVVVVVGNAVCLSLYVDTLSLPKCSTVVT